jgi:transposase-like protein
VSPAPVCPRCRSAAYVVRGGVTGHLWRCLSCEHKSRHLERAITLWRLSEGPGPSRPIRVKKRRAA